jgi:hypothetical protein
MESLTKSMSDFSYDPENGVTFSVWNAWYNDLFFYDAKNIDDPAKVRSENTIQ